MATTEITPDMVSTIYLCLISHYTSWHFLHLPEVTTKLPGSHNSLGSLQVQVHNLYLSKHACVGGELVPTPAWAQRALPSSSKNDHLIGLQNSSHRQTCAVSTALCTLSCSLCSCTGQTLSWQCRNIPTPSCSLFDETLASTSFSDLHVTLTLALPDWERVGKYTH